jgi:hypothetical protein
VLAASDGDRCEAGDADGAPDLARGLEHAASQSADRRLDTCEGGDLHGDRRRPDADADGDEAGEQVTPVRRVGRGTGEQQ